MEKNVNLLVAHRLLGEPLVTEKNGFEKNLDIFSKFHHTHEHEQTPIHQQGLIGLI